MGTNKTVDAIKYTYMNAIEQVMKGEMSKDELWDVIDLHITKFRNIIVDEHKEHKKTYKAYVEVNEAYKDLLSRLTEHMIKYRKSSPEDFGFVKLEKGQENE